MNTKHMSRVQNLGVIVGKYKSVQFSEIWIVGVSTCLFKLHGINQARCSKENSCHIWFQQAFNERNSCCTLPRAILSDVFLVYHILLSFHSPKGAKCEKIRHLENSSHKLLFTYCSKTSEQRKPTRLKKFVRY